MFRQRRITHVNLPFLSSSLLGSVRPSKRPLAQPNIHPLLPHSRQLPHTLARRYRLLGLQHRLLLRAFLTHCPVEIQQLDAGVLAYVFGPQSGGRLERREPGGEGDGFDGFGGGEVGGHGWDERVPGTCVGVHDVVVVEGWRGVGGCEDEVKDDVGGYVDGDPGYGVLARERGGDLAEIFGACYDLCVERRMLAP